MVLSLQSDCGYRNVSPDEFMPRGLPDMKILVHYDYGGMWRNY